MDLARDVVEMSGKSELIAIVDNFMPKYSNTHKYSIFPKIVEGNSKDLYKEQKVCIICHVKVADLGVIDKKKYSCQFCYNAVCQGCSPLKCYHPHTLKEERVCMQCYFNAIEIKVRNELKTEVEASIGEDENKNLRLSLENEVKDLETEIGALEIHLDKAKGEEERLRKEKMAIFEERSKKTAEIESEHTKETERLNEQIAKIDKEIGNGKEYLAKQEKDIESCKDRLEEQKMEMQKLMKAIEVEKEKDKLNDNTVETTFSRSSEKQELIDELNRLKAQIVDLQAEQANLQKILTSKLNK